MALAEHIEDGRFSPRRIAHAVGATTADVAFTVGLGRDAVQRRERVKSDRTQRRLRELSELITRVTPRFGSEMLAFAWVRSQPLAGFGGLTAMQLLQQGQSEQVLDYLDAVDAGVFH